MESAQPTFIGLIEEMCAEKNICLEPMQTAQDIMSIDIKTLTLDHTIEQGLKFMKANKVRHIPVVDVPSETEEKPHFIGIVSERDILRLSEPYSEENDKQDTNQRALRKSLVQAVTRNPKSVSLQTPVQNVIMTMILNRIDMVPVLDNTDLVGIITVIDIMKLFFKLDKVLYRLRQEFKKDVTDINISFVSESSMKVEVLNWWLSRTVQEIMTEQVICLASQDDLATAMKVMQKEEIRHAVILDELQNFTGLISDRDILRNLPHASKRPPLPPKIFREHLFATDPWNESLQLPLENIMQKKVLCIPPDCTIYETADILYKKKISCLPVIDEQKKLRGIVTITDMMRVLLGIYEPVEQNNLTLTQNSIC